MSPNKKKKKNQAFERKQGNRNAVGKKQSNISFNFSKYIKGEGQTFEEWSDSGLLVRFITRMQNIGNGTALQATQKQWIKEYHKVDFPPDSKFTEPKHVVNVTWAVMHLTCNSKEVVAGYIEDDVFYVIFLDKDHKFWPMKKR